MTVKFSPKTSPSASPNSMRNRLPNVRHHSQTPGEVPTHRLLNFPKVAKFSPFQRTSLRWSRVETRQKKKKLRVRCATARCAWRVRGRASCSSVSPKCSPSLLPLSLSNFHSSYLSQTIVCCTNSDTFPHRGIKTAQRWHAAFFGT